MRRKRQGLSLFMNRLTAKVSGQGRLQRCAACACLLAAVIALAVRMLHSTYRDIVTIARMMKIRGSALLPLLYRSAGRLALLLPGSFVFLKSIFSAFFFEKYYATSGPGKTGTEDSGEGFSGYKIPSSIIHSGPHREQGFILDDPRVRRLQGAAAVSLFRRHFRIDLSAEERELLSNFAGISWVLSNLLTAAGGLEALASRTELSHRLSVVFPVFLKSLRLHLAYERAGTGSLRKRMHRISARFRRKHASVGLDGSIIRSLYPRALAEARIQARRESIRLCRDGLLFRLQLKGELQRFTGYLEGIRCIEELYTEGSGSDGSGGNAKCDNQTIIRTVETLSSKYEE